MRWLRSLLLLLCLSTGLLAAAHTQEVHYLHQSLRKAQPGDYLVTLQGKLYTLLHIHSRTGNRMVIEEISVPKAYFNPSQERWRDWVAAEAPRHSAWCLYEIDLDSGHMLEYYSRTQHAWGSIDDSQNFLSTLLHLQLAKVGKNDRKRVGPAPLTGQLDRRSFWNPRLIVDGAPVPGVEFDQWRGYWPRDGSELSGKMIDLFLPSDPEHALSYFPAWLEVAGALGRAQLRIVDSGKGLVSPQTALPRRPPKIVSIRAVPKDGIEVTAAAPLYYHGFSLLASPEGSKIRSFIELSHRFSVDSEDESLVHLFVTEEELAQRLQAGQRYHFYLQPNGYPEVLGEARESWLYKSTL